MIARRAECGFSVFDTALGSCGVAWRGEGICAVQLPELDAARVRERLLERAPGAIEAKPPRSVARAVRAIQALLEGESVDLAGVLLDMADVPPFHRRVYESARGIPRGQTLTYGALAARLGSPGAARAVGQALRNNPFALVVPCHRVLAAGGKLGGFTAEGGARTKSRLLVIEGVPLAGVGGRAPRR